MFRQQREIGQSIYRCIFASYVAFVKRKEVFALRLLNDDWNVTLRNHMTTCTGSALV